MPFAAILRLEIERLDQEDMAPGFPPHMVAAI